MPHVQTLGGRDVASPILIVAGGSRRFKAIPIAPERLPFRVSRVRTPLVEIERLDNREGPNFATFSLRATAVGDTQIEVAAASGGAPLRFGVTVLAPVSLPPEQSVAGLLTRLFLAENPTPGPGYSAAEVGEALFLMRVVVENRLANPSGRWASANARTMSDVVRARGQFEGFETYPHLTGKPQQTINDILKIANDASEPLLPAMRAHLQLAYTAATMPRPRDPTRTGLYWWRTSKSAPPGSGVFPYTTKGKNTFWREAK